MLFLVLAGSVQARPVTLLNDSARIQPVLEFWQEGSLPDKPDLQSLIEYLEGHPGQDVKSQSAGFGYTTEAHWFRLEVINPDDFYRQRLLVVPAPQLDEVWFLKTVDGEIVEEARTGENYPFAQRALPVPEYAFPVTLPPRSLQVYYFRAQSEGSLLFPLKIWKEREYLLAEEKRSAGRALYYGLLLFIIIFNFFLYLTLREPVYILYVGFISVLLLVQATLHGKTFQYLWPNMPYLQNGTILIGVPLMVLLANEFSRHFLAMPSAAPRLNKVLIGLGALCGLNIVASFFVSPELAKGGALLLALITIVVLLLAGPLLWLQGLRQARLYTCGWLLLLIGSSLTALLEFGILPYSVPTAYGVQIGSAAEAIILSLAIVDRVYHERQERLKIQEDIIEAQRQQQQTEATRLHEATHSHTSELPNRAFLQGLLKQQLRHHPSEALQLVLVRINRYHDIDRTLGQDLADQLIYQIGIRINEFLAGLDEFETLEQGREGPIYLAALDESTLALLLREPPSPQPAPVASLADYLLERIQYGHMSLDLDPRLGIACYPEDSETVDGMIRAAKVALDSTRHLVGCIARYQPDNNPYSERRLTLMAELDQAMSDNHLYLCFQPILNMHTRHIVAFEGLIRWNHPQHGEISPAEFIPLAEQSGNIVKLTQWVIRKGLSYLQELKSLGMEDIGIHLNLSAVDLESRDFLKLLDRHIEEAGLTRPNLTLELTETSVMKEPRLALSILSDLKARQIQVAMDDFGTGYSSLSYLRDLPLQKIKIDRAFVHELDQSEDARVIINTVVSMCQSLGYTVVAEGVETEETAVALWKLKCDELQGFWLARPMLWDFAVEWLKAYRDEGGHERMSRLFH